MSLRSQKSKLLNTSTESFLSSVEKMEGQLHQLVLGIIENLDREDGRLISSAYNRNQILQLGRELEDAFANSRLNRRVQEWVPDFEKLLQLNRRYWGGQGWDFTQQINEILSDDMQMRINQLVSDLTGPGVDVNVIQGLQKKIQEGIVTRQRYSDLKEVVKEYLVTDAQQGQLLRYASVITQDAINGFDGSIQKVVADEYEMDGFNYVGSLIKDSRLTCIALTSAPGRVMIGKNVVPNPYADLVLPGGAFRIKDIPEIIERSYNNPGWNKSTTPDTFFIYRGGYNCRHEALPTMLLESQKK